MCGPGNRDKELVTTRQNESFLLNKPKSNLNRLRDVIDKIPVSRRQEADSFFIGFIASDIPESALVDALDALKQRFGI